VNYSKMLPIKMANPIEGDRRGDIITIGGSQIASIMGISPFEGSTPHSTWLYLTGRDDGKVQTEAMEIGIEIEVFIADLYAKKTGATLMESPKLYGVQDDDEFAGYSIWDYPWASASPDRIILSDSFETNEGLEIKNASEYVADHWADGIPKYYEVQARWYMALTGLPVWHFAVLIGGNKLRMFTVSREVEEELYLLETVGAWYEKHIVNDEEPGKTDDEFKDYAKGAVVDGRWVGDAANCDEVDDLFEELTEATENRKAWEKIEEDKKAAILRYSEGFTGIEAYRTKSYMKWTIGKEARVTDWEAVAVSLGADGDIIEANTTTKAGKSYPRFTLK